MVLRERRGTRGQLGRGAETGDEEREKEGQAQGAWGKTKDKADDAWESTKDAAESAKESVEKKV